MKMVRSVTASVAMAVLATSVTPAMAQGYPGYGYGYGYKNGYGNRGYDRHRRHDRGISAGDVIAGVAVVGIIAAIAAAASKSNNRSTDDRYRGNINSEDQAADACAVSAEQRLGNGARVSNIDTVARTRDGYEVRGTIDTRDYRSNRDDRDWGRDGGRDGGQRFTCSVRYGQVEDVRIDNGYAYRSY